MKKTISIMLCILMMLSAVMTGGVAANAETLKSGDFEYTVLSDGGVEISNYTGTATEVTVPEKIDGKNVESIGQFAFYIFDTEKTDETVIKKSIKIKSVTLPKGITSIDNYAFLAQDELTSVTLPATLESIGSGAFGDCKSLETIEVPESVTKIDSNAFQNCEKLADIKIGSKIKEIFVSAFEGTAYKNSDSNWESGALYLGSCLIGLNKTVQKDFNVKEGTTVIAYNIFDNENKIESFSIPKSIKYIPEYLFSVSTSLKSITVSEENENYSSLEGVLFNKKRTVLIAYPIAKESESYTVPDGVKKIGDSAFANSVVKEVTLPNSVKKIESDAFKSSALESVKLGNKVEYIGFTAFARTPLSSIYVPRSVTKIERLAFGRKASAHLEKYTVYGCSGSYTEKYCKKNNIDFKAVDPAAPKKTTVKGEKGKIKVSYKKVSKAEGFQVKATKGKKSVVKTYKTKKSVIKAVKGLKKGNYKVKVRAFRTFRGSRVYGKWTKAKTVKVK